MAWAFNKASSKIYAFWSDVEVEETCIIAGESAGIDWDKSLLVIKLFNLLLSYRLVVSLWLTKKKDEQMGVIATVLPRQDKDKESDKNKKQMELQLFDSNVQLNRGYHVERIKLVEKKT